MEIEKNKTSQAQLNANKRYREKNRERQNYLSKKRTAKSFILKFATNEDIQEVKQWLSEREQINPTS
ncbi:hypothetical protein [Melissococcus plutonius]|uniref:hypothetical protein n=1 Tax=Melissococcus plutonius TaxID=33970 RepID=UPI00065E414A|nr:hypothetical protein [Melissococcus plutonius]KMT32023.1 hypothetical protein MEPL6_3c00040 [Melissococcus plutonius]